MPDIISFDNFLIKYIYLDLDFFRNRDNTLPNYVLFFYRIKYLIFSFKKG